jgi:hypothetical protein
MMMQPRKAVAVFALLIFTFGSFMFAQPKQAHALFGIDFCGTFFICLDPINDVSGVVSAGANTTTAGASTVTAATNTTKLVVDGTPAERAVTDVLLTPTICDAFANANLLLDTLDSAGNALAGADKTKLTNTFFISYKVESTRSQLRDCWLPLELIAQNAKGVTNSQAQNLEANRTLIASKKQTLTLQLVDYEKQKKQSFQDIFEAIAFNLGQAAVNEAAVKGVNSLVDNLKIGDYGRYADALATQVFNIQEIKKNSRGDQEKELIAASLYRATITGDASNLNTATALASQKAKQYNVDPDNLDWSDPSYWNKVSVAGDERTWPQYHILNGQDTVNKSVASAHELAHAEMATSEGFKSMRNCTDITSQQQQIDADLAAASTKMQEAELTLAIAQERSDATVLAQARQAYVAAQTEYKAAQAKSNGGFAVACGAITKPAQLISQTATKWLGTLFDQNSTYNSANPTLLGSLISKFSKRLFDDILDGNNRNGSVLNDVGDSLIPVGVNAGLQGIISAAANNTPTLPTNTPTTNNPPSGSGGVLGASTISPRGPQVPFLPRGPENSYSY